MVGNDKVRFCNTCSLNVYNLSAMTRDEAQGVLDAAPGRLCVRFYRREDGRVLTRDCPIGAADRQHKAAANLTVSAVAALALLAVQPQGAAIDELPTFISPSAESFTGRGSVDTELPVMGSPMPGKARAPEQEFMSACAG